MTYPRGYQGNGDTPYGVGPVTYQGNGDDENPEPDWSEVWCHACGFTHSGFCPRTPTNEQTRERQVYRLSFIKALALLQKAKTGDCWCPCGIGNPMMRHGCTDDCKEIQAFIKEHEATA